MWNLRLAALLALVALPALSADRAAIRLPEGCAFEASDEGAPVPPASRCAQMLLNVNRAFSGSSWRETCSEWPDLQSLTLGSPVEGVEFFPLGKSGHFLMRVRCTVSAEAEQSLVFDWDDRAKSSDELPPLILFPSADGSTGPLVAWRDFDGKKGTLWEFLKQGPDGSAGRYRRFAFEGFTPVLEEQVFKDEVDHQNGWTFSRRGVPKGTGWKHEQVAVRGCVGSLERSTCTR